MVVPARVQIFGKSIASLSLAHCLQKQGIGFRFFDAIPKTLDDCPSCNVDNIERYTLSKRQKLCIPPRDFAKFKNVLDEDKFARLKRLTRDQASSVNGSELDHPSKEASYGRVRTTTATLENNLNALLDDDNRAKPGEEEAIIPFRDSNKDEVKGDDGVSDRVINVLADTFGSSGPLGAFSDGKPIQDLSQNKSLSVSGLMYCTPDEYLKWLRSDAVSKRGHSWSNVNDREGSNVRLKFSVWQDLPSHSETEHQPASVYMQVKSGSGSSSISQSRRLRYMLSITAQNSLLEDGEDAAMHQNEQIQSGRTSFYQTIHRRLLRRCLQKLSRLPNSIDLGLANAIEGLYRDNSDIDIHPTEFRLLSKKSLHHQQQQNNIVCIGAAAHAIPFAGPAQFVGEELNNHILDGKVFADCVVQHGATPAASKSFYDQRYSLWESWHTDVQKNFMLMEFGAKSDHRSLELSAGPSKSSAFSEVEGTEVNEVASLENRAAASPMKLSIRRTASTHSRGMRHVQLSRNSVAPLDHESSPRSGLLDLSTPLEDFVPRNTASPGADVTQPTSSSEEVTSSDSTSLPTPLTQSISPNNWQSQRADHEPLLPDPIHRIPQRGSNPTTAQIISHLDTIASGMAEDLSNVGELVENLSHAEARISFRRGEVTGATEQRRRGYGRASEDWQEERSAVSLDLEKAQEQQEREGPKLRQRRGRRWKKDVEMRSVDMEPAGDAEGGRVEGVESAVQNS